jgi:hypothetical protein
VWSTLLELFYPTVSTVDTLYFTEGTARVFSVHPQAMNTQQLRSPAELHRAECTMSSTRHRHSLDARRVFIAPIVNKSTPWYPTWPRDPGIEWRNTLGARNIPPWKRNRSMQLSPRIWLFWGRQHHILMNILGKSENPRHTIEAYIQSLNQRKK